MFDSLNKSSPSNNLVIFGFLIFLFINWELFVSDGIHQAKIEFGEKGVKAAAVTVLIMYEKSAIEPQKKTINITFDRPFMYVIRDKKTKDVWFMGTVYEPNLWEKDKKDYQSR